MAQRKTWYQTVRRWDEIRGPTRKELNGTPMLELPIEEASAQIRTGGPIDNEEDFAMPVWAGVLSLQLKAGTPIPDERLPDSISVFGYVKRRR